MQLTLAGDLELENHAPFPLLMPEGLIMQESFLAWVCIDALRIVSLQFYAIP
jgi:hypothetical protein